MSYDADSLPRSAESADQTRAQQGQFPEILSETSQYRKFSEMVPTYDLPERQLRAIELLIEGFIEAQIATILHVSPRTLYNWRTHDPRYQAALRAAREFIHTASIDQLLTATTRAVRTLFDVMDEQSPSLRMRAAQILLTNATRASANDRLPRPPKPTSEQPVEIDPLDEEPDLPPKVG